MNERNLTVSQCHHSCGVKCISWSAIFLGAVVALGLSFLFNLFATAIGLSIYSVNAEGVTSLTVGGMLGFAIGIIAIMFFAGWVAAYFGSGDCHKKHCGCAQGFAAWAVALILMVILSMPFAQFSTRYSDYLAHKTVATMADVVSDKLADKSNVSTAEKKAVATELSQGAFVLFLMFFFGAAASTAGGHLAGSCSEKKACNHCGKSCS